LTFVVSGKSEGSFTQQQNNQPSLAQYWSFTIQRWSQRVSWYFFALCEKRRAPSCSRSGRCSGTLRVLMNLKKFIRWPSPLNVAVHLQRANEFPAGARTAALMSRPEHRRASGVRSLTHRKMFMARQSLVRQVLSVVLDCAPEAVPIVCQPNGKPGILGQGIQFNISHCQDWCAVAWSAESAVGVDVEVVRPVRDMEAIVSNFFPPIAQQAFHSASPQNQTRVFFRWWARIEAALKASGKDLDDSYECLDDVLHEVCDAIPGVALAVAVVGTGPLTITWHLP